MLSIADFVTDFSTMFTGVTTIISSIITFITSNWLLMGMIALGLGIPVVFSIFSWIKNRGH